MADDSAAEAHAALVALETGALQDVEELGKVPLSDKARSQKLSAAIQDKFARIRALTRDLELEVEELDSDDERPAAAKQLAQHKAQYARLQTALRDAALAQRTSALRSAQEERRELLAGGDVGLRQRRVQAEGDAVATAEEVTGGLRRTRQVLAEELEHTSATLAAMEASHAALGATRDEYRGQHRKLRRSRGLLGTLNWQAKSETYMLWIGLTVFLAVCGYVLQKRASHFIPAPLRPSNLLASLAGPPRVGKPLAAPSLHTQTQGRPGQAPHRGRHPAGTPRRPRPAPAAHKGAGRGRAPPPQPHLPPPDAAAPKAGDAAGGSGAAQRAPPYGGFVDPDDDHVVSIYQPTPSAGTPGGPSLGAEQQQQQQQQADRLATAQGAAQVQPEHLVGAEKEREQLLTSQPAEAGPAEQEQGVQGGEERGELAEWPAGAPEPAHEEQQQVEQAEQQQVEAAPEQEASSAHAAAVEEEAVPVHEAGVEQEAAAEQQAVEAAAELEPEAALAHQEQLQDAPAEPEAPAAGHEEPVTVDRQHEHQHEAAAAEAHSAAGQEGSVVERAVEEQPALSSGVLSRDGRRIAVDGPDFVRPAPQQVQKAQQEPANAEDAVAAESGAEAEHGAEQQVQDAAEHEPAEWPSGAPEPRDEL